MENRIIIIKLIIIIIRIKIHCWSLRLQLQEGKKITKVYLFYVHSIVRRKHDSSCRLFGGIQYPKLVHTADASGDWNNSNPVRPLIELGLVDRYGHIILCCFLSMPHLINRSDWKAVVAQSLSNPWGDVFSGDKSVEWVGQGNSRSPSESTFWINLLNRCRSKNDEQHVILPYHFER